MSVDDMASIMIVAGTDESRGQRCVTAFLLGAVYHKRKAVSENDLGDHGLVSDRRRRHGR